MNKIKIIFFVIIIMILGIGISIILVPKLKKEKELQEMEYMKSVYQTGLSQYLVDELDLEKYDQELLQSDLHFIPYPKEKQREAQKRDQLGLTFIYFRNEIHLEHLSEEEMESFKMEFQNSDGELSDELMNIIIDTYKEVIPLRKIESEEDKKVETTFDNNMKWVDMNSLILRISTNEEYDENGNLVDEDHEGVKQNALKEFSERMEKELEGRLGDTPVRVQLEFSPFSDYENGFLNY